MNRALIPILLIILSLNLFAQKNQQIAVNTKPAAKGIVSGKILDNATNTPIEYANVLLLAKNNSQMVSGIATDKNGGFYLNNIPVGNYDLSVAFIGFKKKIIPDINITNENPLVNLNEIKLLPEAVQLNENEVVGERSAVEFKIDKKVVNVSQNLSATGGTAVDVLQNQPSIQIDANGNVTLRGSSNFTVMVDGRPSVLQGTDALKQIPANTIDNIELITNPSAKYDAEGTSGIINIVTKKNYVSNTSGIFNSGIGSRDKYNGDFNVGYKTTEYNLTLGGDARRMNFFQDIKIDRAQDNLSNILTKADIHGLRDAYTARLAVDRYFDENTTLGLNASYGYVNMDLTAKTNNNITTADPTLNTTGLTNDKTNTKAEYVNASVNFSKIFTPKVNDIYFEGVITSLSLPSEQITTENSKMNGSDYSSFKGRENNTKRIDGRLKLNYKHNLGEKRVFETGLQANFFLKKMDIISKNFNEQTQLWEINTPFTNKYDFKNNIYAAYATFTDQLEGFDYQAGLRIEYTDRLLDQITTGQKYKYAQAHLFPSLSISKQLSDGQQLQLSYSRRIQRPFDNALNPFTNYSDSYTAISGNPQLKPSFTHSVELNYQKSFTGWFLTVQTYLRKTNDGIEQTQTLLDNKLDISFNNVLNTTSIGSEISSNITLAPWFKLDPSVNLYNYSLQEKPEYDIKAQEFFTWNARLNTTLMLSASTRFQFFANYFSKNITSQGDIKSFTIVGASMRQEFLERSLIATISAQNLFGLTKFDVYSSGAGYISKLNVNPEAPVFNLTISYNFNNFKRKNTEQVDLNLNSGL